MWARKESTFEPFDRVIMDRFLDTGGGGWWGAKGVVFSDCLDRCIQYAAYSTQSFLGVLYTRFLSVLYAYTAEMRDISGYTSPKTKM